MAILRKLECRHSCDDCGKRYCGCTLVGDIPGLAEDYQYVCDDWGAHSPSKPACRMECITKEDAQKLLPNRMSALSEERSCAGWAHEVEYLLWENVIGMASDLYAEQRRELKCLSARAGGWFVWKNGPCFVPMDEWLRMYEKRKADGKMR